MSHQINRATVLRGSLVAASALLFLLQFPWKPAPFTVRMEILTEQATRVTLRYEGGDRASQQGEISRILDGTAAFQTIRFPIDQNQLMAFHLKQWGRSSPFRLRNIVVERRGGGNTLIELDRLQAHAGVATLRREQGEVEILPTGRFEQTDLSIEPPEMIRRAPLAVLLGKLLPIVLALACVALVWTNRQTKEVPQLEKRARLRGLRLRTSIIGVLIFLYLAASGAGLNGSSCALWRLIADYKNPEIGILLGSPKFIRSDEWIVHTPWLLSQYYRQPSLSLTNRDVGEGPAPLLTSLPVRHWSMIFRPQYLGFLFLPLEQAFAFYWNFKWFALLLGAFLFFDILTHGRSGLALFGAALILFSGFTQWWFSSPTMMPEMLAMFFFGCWSVTIILNTSSRWAAAGSAIVLLIAVEQFAFCSYPRFQIPLLYLAFFIVIGVVVRALRERTAMSRRRSSRVALVAGTLAVATLIFWSWFAEVRELIASIQGLIYPGQILHVGGSFPWFWFLAPFFEFAMTEERFPVPMTNACEASGHLFLLPIVLALIVRDALRKKFDPLLIAPATCALLLVCFMCIGIPESLARWTGLALVAPNRATLGVGIASFIAVIRYLGRRDPEIKQSTRYQIVSYALLALFLGWIFSGANLHLDHYLSRTAVAVVSLYFALVFLMIWQRRPQTVCALLLSPCICAYGLVNPIGNGLSEFTGSELWRMVRAVEREDPQATWLAIGPQGWGNVIAQFLKSTGAHAVGGARITPDSNLIRSLDPDEKYRQVHQRYANVSFVSSTSETPTFELKATDAYAVHLPVTTDYIRRLGVRYLLQIDTSENKENIPGFEEFRVYKGIRFLRAIGPPS